jgi:hypothetical protein
MNDFLFAHKKNYTNIKGQSLTVQFDVNLKKNTLTALQFSGNLAEELLAEIEELTKALININLNKIAEIKIKNSPALGLFYAALEEYLGHVPVNQSDIICLCLGIKKAEIKVGMPNMAGRACGSCIPFIRPQKFNKILSLYPGPLSIKLDQLREEWQKNESVRVTIENINDDKLDVKIVPYSRDKLHSLSDYFFKNLNTRFFLRGVL